MLNNSNLPFSESERISNLIEIWFWMDKNWTKSCKNSVSKHITFCFFFTKRFKNICRVPTFFETRNKKKMYFLRLFKSGKWCQNTLSVKDNFKLSWSFCHYFYFEVVACLNDDSHPIGKCLKKFANLFHATYARSEREYIRSAKVEEMKYAHCLLFFFFLLF